jgi:peptide/nickel transport system permease protein
VAAVAFLALVVVAAFAPGVLAPSDPNVGDTAQALQAPGAAHWFGTDHLGRDLYTRVVHGTALSLRTALIAVSIALVSGGIFGLVAGFLGGWVDQVVMRVVDVLLAIPSLLLSLALISALGFGSTNVAIAVAIGSVATFARIARSQSLRVCQAAYVEAARSMGSRWYRTLFRHVVPNSLGPIIALAVLEFGMAILSVSALSFLGYGAPRPAPEWGSLVSEGRNYLAAAGWLTTLPGLVIAATVLSVNRLAALVNNPGGKNS